MTSSLLPTYARVNLAFERGEGAWLTSTTGERFLDFGGGIAVASLGHGHPHLVAALHEQGGKSGTPPICSRSRRRNVWPGASSRSVSPTTYFSPIRARKPSKARSRRRANINRRADIRKSSALSLSPGHFTDARSRQSPRPAIPNISRASVRESRASNGALRRSWARLTGRDRPANRRNIDRADSGRRRDPCGAAGLPTRLARALR